MYGKIFESTFTGSMMGAGSDVFAVWAYVVANVQGSEIELNPKLLSTLIGTPVERIEAAVDFLCQPDPYSRSKLEEGRRLIKNGQFQYHVVNYEEYNKIRKAEERREYLKEKQREHRARQQCQQPSTGVKPNKHVNLPYSDTEPLNTLSGDARLILAFLNEKTGRNYQPVKANLDLIRARLKEGATVQDCKTMIARKARSWKGDEKMDQYLRPKTLFNRTNFAQYMGECVAK